MRVRINVTYTMKLLANEIALSVLVIKMQMLVSPFTMEIRPLKCLVLSTFTCLSEALCRAMASL